MFAVVKTIEKESSFFDKFKKPKISCERVPLPDGEYFFVITAEKKRNNVPFREILDFSGNIKNRLIFEKDFEFLPNWNYTPYEPQGLKKKLLFDLAVNTLGQLRLNPLETGICLCDSEGMYIKDIHKLLNFGAKIHIVSHDRGLYKSEAEKILFEYGVSVTVSDSFETGLHNCDVVISHESNDIPLFFKGIIFTNGKRPFMNSRCFSVENIELPFEYEKLRPAGIDKLTFASALYEEYGILFN